MTKDASQSRPALVSLVLLGVLLLAVGGAWLMVRFHYSPSRVGAAILDDMRKQGLPKLWPPTRYVARFQRKDSAGRTLSRLTMTRQPADGNFVGRDFTEALSGASGRMGNVDEIWAVTDDLSWGSYTADYMARGNIGIGFSVKIVLNRDRVSFEGPGIKAVTADAPANYCPEGLKNLVVRQVARGGQKASFQFIANELSLQEKTISLVRMVFTPVSRREVRCRIGGDLETYYLDAAGEVERIQYEDGSVLTPLPVGKSSPPETPPSPEESPDEGMDSDPL